MQAHDELISALQYCSDTMTQMTREAVDAGVDEEGDAHASASLQTLGACVGAHVRVHQCVAQVCEQCRAGLQAMQENFAGAAINVVILADVAQGDS
eukprot:7031879-Alexandrium_andersonii.AAC.1